MVSGVRVCSCKKDVWRMCFRVSGVCMCSCKKGVWSMCFQATYTRDLPRAAAAYASASSACPDADAEDAEGAHKNSETLGSGAGRIGHRQGNPPTGAGAWKSVL